MNTEGPHDLPDPPRLLGGESTLLQRALAAAKSELPSAEKLAQIASALETTADYLLEGDGANEAEDATDIAFYRKYKKLDAPVKEQLRKMLNILDDD